MKQIFVLFLAIVAPIVFADPQLKRQTIAPSVNTSSGLISGHAAPNATTVSEYLGIPFAKPPLGDLRFKPPQPYNGSSTINGTDFGFACLTVTAVAAAGGTGNLNIAGANITAAGISILSTFAQLFDKFSEDCLTLNVWVPSGGASGKAVMLWLYGGGFDTGSTSTPEYNGKYLASQEDVIVVSVNYRLNIFGFPGNPSEPQLNLGLLDQRLGIEWTRDNIASFGGDPSRIRIFGQSAGSASVDYYSYAYVDDPIVAGFIQESGTVNGFGQVSTSDANAGWFNVSSQLNCGNSSSNATETLSCMQVANSTEILMAMAGSATFGPSIDNLTVFSDYPARSSAGNFIKVPLLIGSADYEAGQSAAIDALSNITYPKSYWLAETLNTFTCPAGIRANISVENDVPTWRYRWFGDFPNIRLTSVPDSGAYHTSEIMSIFDTAPAPGNGIPPATDEENAIGTYMRGAWAAFAKDPKAGLNGYGGGWPVYNPGNETLIRLAYQNLTGTNLASPAIYDANCTETNGTAGGASATATSSGSATPTSVKSASNSARVVQLSLLVGFSVAIVIVLLS